MKIDKNEFLQMIKENVTEARLEAVRPESTLAEIGIDSLGFATLLFAIEDKLNVRIDEGYLEKLNDLSTISELIATFKTLGYEIEV